MPANGSRTCSINITRGPEAATGVQQKDVRSTSKCLAQEHANSLTRDAAAAGLTKLLTSTSQIYVLTCHLNVPPQSATSMCHLNVPPQRATSTSSPTVIDKHQHMHFFTFKTILL